MDAYHDLTGTWRRALRGARGLKLRAGLRRPQDIVSRPARGAWIETMQGQIIDIITGGRALRGARGLKLAHGAAVVPRYTVAPCAGRVD